MRFLRPAIAAGLLAAVTLGACSAPNATQPQPTPAPAAITVAFGDSAKPDQALASVYDVDTGTDHALQAEGIVAGGTYGRASLDDDLSDVMLIGEAVVKQTFVDIPDDVPSAKKAIIAWAAAVLTNEVDPADVPQLVKIALAKHVVYVIAEHDNRYGSVHYAFGLLEDGTLQPARTADLSSSTAFATTNGVPVVFDDADPNDHSPLTVILPPGSGSSPKATNKLPTAVTTAVAPTTVPKTTAPVATTAPTVQSAPATPACKSTQRWDSAKKKCVPRTSR